MTERKHNWLDRFVYLSPWLILSSYLAFLFLALAPGRFAFEATTGLYVALASFFFCLVIAFNYGWPASVAWYLSKTLQGHPYEGRKILVTFFLSLALLLSPVIVELAFLNPNLIEDSALLSAMFPLLGSLGWIGLLRVLWVASRLMVFSEVGTDVPANRVVGTFVAFLFLPIGVFSLARRLHKQRL